MEYAKKYLDFIQSYKIDKNYIWQDFIEQKAQYYRFSFQELRIIFGIAIDFDMWKEKSIEYVWQDFNDKKQVLKYIKTIHQDLKEKPNNYQNFSKSDYKQDNKDIDFKTSSKDYVGLGTCPVASEKTRCCNLLTLDVVESCGFDCSYCSIQSFYSQNTISFDKNIINNLNKIKLNPKQTYHIGTGQSSDSLMWGNKYGLLDALIEFAKSNPNAIIELKTKSNNIKYLIDNEIPKNIIVTWSLNTQTIIDNEEHLTSSLSKRIQSARRLADKGILVGFHFHPIIEYENYLQDYKQIFQTLINTFKTSEVVMVSFGTLTFIKPVLKKLKQRGLKSKILQMPFVDANGKFSYPLKTKIQMFKTAYESFKPWHKNVFFYLCMEEHNLWKEVFGYEYISNSQFEDFMLRSYMDKIELNKKIKCI